MTLGQKQEAFSRDLVKLLQKAFELGYEVRIGEVMRGRAQQEHYLRTGRTTTMNSLHLMKLAADLHFTRKGRLDYPAVLGEYWESLDPKNEAGMFWKSFKDSAHFQRNL
jgi:hypothetical protein